MAKHLTTKGGFTLLELMIYLSVFTVVAGLFLNIFVITARVQVRETADTEVASQLQFAMQTIQRLIRESSAVTVGNFTPCRTSDNLDANVGSQYDCLRLRMKDQTKDPTCIMIRTVDAKNYIAVIPPVYNTTTKEYECSNDSSDYQLITTNKVSPTFLKFTRFTNSPGHDAIQIDLTLDYIGGGNTQLSKTLRSAVGRVSAATFDSGLIPGTSGSFNIGAGTSLWQILYVNTILGGGAGITIGDLSNPVIIGNYFYEANNYDAADRGLKIIGLIGNGTRSCNAVCTAHNLSCSASLQTNGTADIGCTTVPVLNAKRYCWCY